MKLNKIYLIFSRLNVIIQLLIFTLISLLASETLFLIFQLINKEDVFKLDFSEYTKFEMFFEAVFLAPLIETVIFQFILIELFLYGFSKLPNTRKYVLSVLLSGTFFGILHLYNTSYMIATAILGWIFGSIYIFYKINQKIKPFFAVFIIHSFDNLITLFIDHYV